MSFDIFFQRFSAGDGADADAALVASALEPYLFPGGGDPCLRVGEAEADIYGLEDLASGFMVNHCHPGVLAALVEVATKCDLVILPVGCPTAITNPRQRDHLPEALASEVIHVKSGDDLRRLIESG